MGDAAARAGRFRRIVHSRRAGGVAHPARLPYERPAALGARRGSGATLCALGAALAFSGYLLYYFAPESLRPALGWAHSLAGMGMAALVVVHRRPKSRRIAAG